MTTDLHALTGAYALDALPEDEAALFEEHLHHCAACRNEVAEFHATSAELGDAIAMTPPASMKASVLAQIAVTRQESPKVVALPQTRVTQLRRFAMPVAAGLAAIAVGLGVVVGQLNGRVDDLEGRSATVMAIMAQPDVAMIAAPGPDGSTAHAMLSPGSGEGMIVFSDLQAAPGDQVWQLWAIGEGGIHSMDIFEAEADGTAARMVRGDMTGVTAIGLTMEPAGGSAQPTQDPVMVLSLSA